MRYRHHVADGHGGDRENDHRAEPGSMHLRAGSPASGNKNEWESKDKDSKKRSKACSFGAGSHERRNWSGRALINVRSPDVKWRAGNLKTKADQHHRRAGKKKEGILRIRQSSGDFSNVCSSR